MNKGPDKQKIIKEISFSLMDKGKTLKVRADGYSMYPAIKPGSLVFIEPTCYGEGPVPGEIVAWKRKSGFVVHRLVRVFKEDNQTYFITRGDSCAREDPPVLAGYISGRVVKIEGKNGKIVTDNQRLKSKSSYFFNRSVVLGAHLIAMILAKAGIKD